LTDRAGGAGACSALVSVTFATGGIGSAGASDLIGAGVSALISLVDTELGASAVLSSTFGVVSITALISAASAFLPLAVIMILLRCANYKRD
jgi:hypothetical protein